MDQRARAPADKPKRSAPARSGRGLDLLNFLLADVQQGVGPFIAIYLAASRWNEERVGLALTVGGLCGIATQAPAGWLVDRLRCKRALIAGGVVALGSGALLIALLPSFVPVLLGQALIGGASSVFAPAICAISLGIVGVAQFDRRQGRNQAFNSAGNVAAAIAMGLLGYFVSNRSIFFLVVALVPPTLLALTRIFPDEIDHQVARGGEGGSGEAAPAGWGWLLRDRTLLLFLGCAVLFHFANAAMLPLVGQALAKGKGRGSMMFMSACVITTQLVVTLASTTIGERAGRWGRKPLLLIGFGVLPLRALLYTLTTRAPLLVAIQLLDGVGAAIFGIVSVLVIADLTRGTGRFNVTLGSVAAAVGAGAALSQVIAGAIVHRVSFRAGFYFLAAVAAVAFAMVAALLPETRKPLEQSGR